MRKLFVVEGTCTFVYVADGSDRHAEDRAWAFINHPDTDVVVDDVRECDSIDDVPVEWRHKEPLGAKEIYGDERIPDCEDFFDGLEDAKKIARGLEKLGYDLEPTFVQDVQQILNDTSIEEEFERALNGAD